MVFLYPLNMFFFMVLYQLYRLQTLSMFKVWSLYIMDILVFGFILFTLLNNKDFNWNKFTLPSTTCHCFEDVMMHICFQSGTEWADDLQTALQTEQIKKILNLELFTVWEITALWNTIKTTKHTKLPKRHKQKNWLYYAECSHAGHSAEHHRNSKHMCHSLWHIFLLFLCLK